MKQDNPLQSYWDDMNALKHGAIYNSDYLYIKTLVLDDGLNDTYGNSREGYEKFKSECEESVGHSGDSFLRTRYIGKEITGYILETSRRTNEPMIEIQKIYERAKDEFFRILECKDVKTFDFWLSTVIEPDYNQPMSYMRAIRSFESMIIEYYSNDEYRSFINKLKN